VKVKTMNHSFFRKDSCSAGSSASSTAGLHEAGCKSRSFRNDHEEFERFVCVCGSVGPWVCVCMSFSHSEVHTHEEACVLPAGTVQQAKEAQLERHEN
jgi:hypothetical protein